MDRLKFGKRNPILKIGNWFPHLWPSIMGLNHFTFLLQLCIAPLLCFSRKQIHMNQTQPYAYTRPKIKEILDIYYNHMEGSPILLENPFVLFLPYCLDKYSLIASPLSTFFQDHSCQSNMIYNASLLSFGLVQVFRKEGKKSTISSNYMILYQDVTRWLLPVFAKVTLVLKVQTFGVQFVNDVYSP